MHADLEHLRRHYLSLPDGALLAIDRSELTGAAQALYDQEVQNRGIEKSTRQAVERPAHSLQKPDWCADSIEVLAQPALPGQEFDPAMEDGRAALEAESIPCFLELYEVPKEPQYIERPFAWRLLVPSKCGIEATNVIDRDLLNEQFEADWRNHLEMLSDEEFGEVTPQTSYCGLFDQVRRVLHVYDEERKRRRID